MAIIDIEDYAIASELISLLRKIRCLTHTEWVNVILNLRRMGGLL